VTGFFARLEERSRSAGSLLCVGLDPRAGSATEALAECRRLIDATAPYAAAFKPNSAFFEALGADGIEVLVEAVSLVPNEIPVILDAKRGDISSTAAAYATAAFDRIGAGSVTVSPYLGEDGVRPFLEHRDAGVWVLCRTSNPGADALQGVATTAGGAVFEEVARQATAWAGPDRLGLVVGATVPEALGAVRAIAPEHWILAPGVGAQLAHPADIACGLRESGGGVLVPVSRAIASAPDPAGAASDLRDALRAVVPEPPPEAGPALARLLDGAGAVRLGEFTLRSGETSSIYVDLRTLSSHPEALRGVARRLAVLASHIPHDRLGAVPYGALPLATAVALESGRPMIWPRPTPKEHGTGAAVEGAFEAGERLLLVDDVATSGASALEAATRLRDAGLVVSDLIVVVERSPDAAAALASEGITLHRLVTLDQLEQALSHI
jgi:uridine monophosphate synthetase